MSNSEYPTPLKYVGWGAIGVGALLLVAPFAPPQAAVFGFITVLLVGATGYLAFSTTWEILYGAADDALPEIPDEDEDYPVDDETVQAYVEGGLTEEEFEDAVEEALEEET